MRRVEMKLAEVDYRPQREMNRPVFLLDQCFHWSLRRLWEVEQEPWVRQEGHGLVAVVVEVRKVLLEEDPEEEVELHFGMDIQLAELDLLDVVGNLEDKGECLALLAFRLVHPVGLLPQVVRWVL
jgi:hypothetical protein